MDREKLILRPYQERMRQFAWDVHRCALWADMGLGKTPTTLMAMVDALYDGLSVERWLVVGPKLVVEDAWPRQLQRWQQFKHLPWRLLGPRDFDLAADYDLDTGKRTGLQFGDRADKRAAKGRILGELPPVTLVSWDWLPWLVKACGRNWPFDGLVLDEAIFAQNATGVRHRAVMHVVHNLKAVRRVVELTGAPVPNGYESLYGQVRMLDQGDRLGATMAEFRHKWMVPEQLDKRSGRVWSWRLAPGARAGIELALSDVAVALRSEDYLQLPPLVQVPHWVRLPPPARRMYDDMERELVARVEGVDVLSASQGVLVGKLLQIAGGLLFDNEGAWHGVHDEKLDKLAELLEGEPGPVLLAYPFQPDWERLRARFKHARHIREPGALDAFRGGRIKLLCMHPGSGAHGVDGLQDVSSCAVWLGATYNADHWQQFNKRLHRDGSRAERVVIHQILAADTIERYVATVRLSEKLSEQAHLLKALMMRVQSRSHQGIKGVGHGSIGEGAAVA
jgi:hypothetical protein